MELKCQSCLKIAPHFSFFQKPSLGKILKSFPALNKNSRRLACAAFAGMSAFQPRASPRSTHCLLLAASAWGRHSMVTHGWSRASPFMSEPPFPSLRILAPPSSLLCSLCCLPAPSPSADASHLSPASASSTAKLIWLQSSEIPARDGDARQFDFCCWADGETKWRGVMGERRAQKV